MAILGNSAAGTRSVNGKCCSANGVERFAVFLVLVENGQKCHIHPSPFTGVEVLVAFSF